MAAGPALASGSAAPDGGCVFVGAATRHGEAYSDMLWPKISDGVSASTSERDGNRFAEEFRAWRRTPELRTGSSYTDRLT